MDSMLPAVTADAWKKAFAHDGRQKYPQPKTPADILTEVRRIAQKQRENSEKAGGKTGGYIPVIPVILRTITISDSGISHSGCGA
ncbi:hypothetical protein [Candidatus Symbiobacter mobilis]|uniref:Uncharacterized protein n=1 Tax=Candidatus Symbiobacter mobilis CR TaxID=946483 RepID=U5N4T2_9BURK|nr:hypothetical protein [Candidatus Symbiobacter mobilis]AGX86280.1 hypothetical protein Cenrod_0147 [Candidatus Symbiobacter mobilis CR]